MTIRYCKMNGPPDNWRDLSIYLNDKMMNFVVEADATEGWLKVVVGHSRAGTKVKTFRGAVRIEVDEKKVAKRLAREVTDMKEGV